MFILYICFHVLAYFYLCRDPFFIFSLIPIIINPTISLKQSQLFFAHFLEYLMLVLDDNM